MAGIRLVLLYVLAWALILSVGLLWRQTLGAGFGLNRTLPSSTAPGAQPPFSGINVQLEHEPDAAMRERLAVLQEAGFGWARQHFDWRTIEPAPGTFEWAGADRMVDAITEAGLEPVVVLDTAPEWAMAAEDRATEIPFAPPADFADFARFAAAFAQRYGDRIRYYQLWDEPNVAPHWGARHVNPVEYAQMLAAAATAIRAVDEDAVILAAALAPTVDRGHLAIDEVYFLQRMIAAGAAPFFDVVAVQPFGFGDSAVNPRQGTGVLNFSRAALIRRALVDAGLGSKPLWAVRYGWNRRLNSPWGTVTPDAQAAYTRDALDRAWHEWPWLAAMGWAVDRPQEPSGLPAWGFALADVSGRPAPVYDALAGWHAQVQPRNGRGATSTPLLAWVAWLMVASVAGWRAMVAARIVDWKGLLAGYRTLPVWTHIVVWTALIALYYLATFPPLIVACWLVAVLLCFVQPQVGLWLAVGLIPFFYRHKEVQLVGAMLTVPPTHMLVLALLPAILHAWRSKRDDRPPLVWWELTPLLLVPLTVVAAVNVWNWPSYMRGSIDLVLVPPLLWLAVRTFAGSQHARKGVLAALFAGGVLAALIGLIGWVQSQGASVDGIRRLVGPHFSPNHTALYLERTLLLGLALVIVVSQAQRAVVLAAVAVTAVALVLTGSRGALLLGVPAGLVVLGTLAVYQRPAISRWLRIRRQPMRIAALGAAILVVAFLLLQQERLSNLRTLDLRLDLWMAASALWRGHFWAGVGPGGFFWSYPAYLHIGAVEVDQLHPHSLWLELVSTWGVMGLAWFVLSAVAIVKALQAHDRSTSGAFWIAAGACAGLAAALIHAQTDTFMLLADLAAWNAVAWALATMPAAERL